MTTVYNLDQFGQTTTHYEGVILDYTPTCSILETRSHQTDEEAGYVVFSRGDRHIEWFYTDRWYSICEIHDSRDDHLKGWCCNFNHPATFESDIIRVDNLRLRIWVDPIGHKLILNRDEFRALPRNSYIHDQVDEAVKRLFLQVSHREPPVSNIPKVVVADPIERIFVDSWDAIERYYITFFISDLGWDWLQPILSLIEELRKRGYDRKVSAHQAHTNFLLARSETLHVFSYSHPYVSIIVNLAGTMDVVYYHPSHTNVEIKAAPIEVTPELQQQLSQLAVLPTYPNPYF